MIRLASTNLIRRAILVGAAICFLGSASSVGAVSLAAQIAALKAQSAQQQAQAAQLQGVANNYQAKVNQLQAQMAALATQISLNQLQYDQLSGQIETNKEKLADAKSALGANLTTMYIASNETPLEMLASSKSLGEYFDQQQYRDSIKDKIQSTMSTILELQEKLAGQQKQVGALLASEHDQQSQLASSRAQVNALLAAASQSAGAANSLLKSTNSLLAQKQAQQAALLQASSRTYTGSIPGASGGSGGACANPGDGRNGGYPSLWCNAAQDSIQTPSGYNRECVSWAGWRWHQMGGPFVNWGNANTWDNYARAAGYSVSFSPSVGAVAQTDRGPFGHVAMVEQVSGSNVVVSEMNYDNAGHFRYGVYPSSYFVYIH